MSKIYVIHENEAWVEPLRAALEEQKLPYEEWFLSEGLVDLESVPPEGIFYNRMSASSHTRDHRYAAELTGAVLRWLESHGRRIVNDSRALRLEISKVEQYESLKRYGVRTPHTIAAVGKKQIVEAARRMQGAFITKHNRAGKGLGVKLFQTVQALEEHVMSPLFEDSVDGITLIQEYIRAPQPFITRVEFVGGEFLYAVRVDTSLGFELCPADVCQVGDAFCPVGENTSPVSTAPRFDIVRDFRNDELISKYRRFLADHGVGIAGIEFIQDVKGEIYTYDVNTNTNYNSDAEREAGVFAMKEVAGFLGRELHALERKAPHPAERKEGRGRRAA